MKRSRIQVDPKKRREQLRAMQERGQRNYEDRLREEGAPKYRRIGRNPERQEQEWERAYESEERVKWVQDQPSVASGDTPCVNAHVPDPSGPSGMGRKADAAWVVPLTLEEERELHRIGVQSFEEKHDVVLQEEARRTDRRWRDYLRNREAA